MKANTINNGRGAQQQNCLYQRDLSAYTFEIWIFQYLIILRHPVNLDWKL